MKQARMENKSERIKRTGMRALAAAASVVLVLFTLTNTSKTVAMAMQQVPLLGNFVNLMTVRNYEYEDAGHHADIKVGQLTISVVPETEEMEKSVWEELQKTTEEINAEIQQLALNLAEQFEEGVKDEAGHEEILVESEVIPTAENYFVLKVRCYQGLGSGYQWNYYYTIDLNTGKRLQLADLFAEGTDYLGSISENIIAQMQSQMAEDENKIFWVNDPFMEEWNFTGISADEKFYIDAKGQIVICFDEGDVAPMYMGALEFVIDNEVIKDIRK